MNESYREIEIQMQDNAEHQIDHCFRSYSGDLLKVKLRELIGEWMWKGFNSGFHEARERAHEFVEDEKTLEDLFKKGETE